MLRQLKQHPRLEGSVQSPLGVVSRTEVRKGRGWLGCLTPGAQRNPPSWREKVPSIL